MLDHLEPRRVTVGGRRARLHLGRGTLALEVLVVALDRRPTIADLRSMFRARSGRRAAPVLIVAPWGAARAAVCGPTEHHPVEHRDLPAEQVEAVCRKALEAAGRHTAIRLLHRLLPALDAPIPGLRNGGLFAMQELERGVPSRGDWATAVEEARGVRELRGRALIEGLGFATEELPGPAMLLLAGDRKTAVAVLLDRPEEIDSASPRFDGVSPVSYALAQADRENLDWVVAVAGGTIRLYPAKPGVGTGRRGRSETFVEISLDLLSDDHGGGYLWLLLSAPALSEGGSVGDILRASEDYAADLGGRLRERVYREVMPSLARAVVAAVYPESAPTADDLQQGYEAALRILYRLLFVAYAEDRGLLPLHASRSYREHSLKRIAQRLGEARRKDIEFGEQPSFWSEVTQICTAVSLGNPEWEVPAYNGTLFASEAPVSKLGARIAALSLPDREFAGALAALLLDRTAEGTEGPVDFRSLGIREFGTIYEGLLESELSLADRDLTVDARTEAYLPAMPGDTVEVRAGEVYLHNRSGARKASGSYYTPAFAVEHLLDRALEPALDEHIERLDGMPDREAGRRFFEFRVADIAMGSGHFLAGAVDRIERRLANYLATRPLPDVREEFARLRRTAEHKLGPDWYGDNPIEDIQLLRRQVARRCVFGVDMNPMAVELARLSLWIHTFVPGLPLSLLDHNLIQGNSLVGIASFEEASELFRTESGNLFASVANERLGAVREPLERLARLTEANNAEIREARELYAGMRRAIRPERELFTLLAASRTNSGIRERNVGVLVITLDTPFDPRDAVDGTFATDNFWAAELIGGWARATMGVSATDASIATLDGQGTQVTVEVLRNQGFLKGFGIDIKNPGKMYDEDDLGINVVYAINEPAAAGAYEALRRLRVKDDVLIVTVDGGCEGVRSVGKGEIGATAMQYPLRMASLGIEAVVKFLATGGRPENTPGLGFHDTGVTLVTEEPVPGMPVHRCGCGVERVLGVTGADRSEPDAPFPPPARVGLIR